MSDQLAQAPAELPTPRTITRQQLIERWLEVISAIMLGVVAVAVWFAAIFGIVGGFFLIYRALKQR